MADAGQAPAAANEGQTPTVTTDTETNPSQDTSSQAEPKTYDEATVKALRAEAASYRTKLREFEKAEEARKQAEMTDLDRAKAQAQAAEDMLRKVEQRAARRDALSALDKAHVIDPELAYSAISEKIEIKDGEPVNIADLVADFVKARPQMVRKPDAAPVLPETHATNPPAAPSIPYRGRPAGRL